MARERKKFDVTINGVMLTVQEPTLGQLMAAGQDISAQAELLKEMIVQCSIPVEELYLSELAQAFEHLVQTQLGQK